MAKPRSLRDLGLALLDFRVVELLDAPALHAHQVIVVLPSFSSNTALPDSKWWRIEDPACSNWVSTR